jgi:excisionase family DNA binding protein
MLTSQHSSALLKPTDAARLLNVTYQRLCALVRNGQLPVVRLGRQFRFDPEAIQQFIRSGGKGLDA